MRYTEAIETSGTIWSLEDFLRQYDDFNIVVNSGKWYGVFSDKDNNTITCIAKNVRKYSVQEILDTPERFEIRVLGIMYCICLKWETINLDATFADEHIVARWKKI